MLDNFFLDAAGIVYTTDDLTEFRALLLAKLDSLRQIAETAAEAAETVTLDQTRVGRVSRMDALQQQAMAQESQRRRQVELQRIALAMQRIETGDYGVCFQCEELIPKARLEFDLCATLCIRCASGERA